MKEGKWMEDMDTNGGMHIVSDNNSSFYRLAIYKAGKEWGTAHAYYDNGKLYADMPYINGKKSGVVKCYYQNGKLMCESPCTNGEYNGMVKSYYENGKLKRRIFIQQRKSKRAM